MTEKRFINDIDIGQLIDTKGELSTIDYSDKVDFYELWEFLNKLNDENEQLKEENKELKELVSEVDNELEIRDIVCGAGKFRLEEWGKHRYHQFYKGDEELEDETVVIMLMELEKENRTLKKENEELKQQITDWETSFDKCKHYKEAYGTEIVKIKQTIKDMIETERTELGRSVLKQLWEAIQ